MKLRDWTARSRPPGMGACTSVGAGTWLRGRPEVTNEGRMVVGARLRLSSSPVVSHLITGPEGELVIGDDVTLSFGAAIFCVSRVCIGDGTRVGPYLALADSDFHVVGNRDAVPRPRPIAIGREVRIGARVTVLPGTTIGDGAVVGAGSTVSGAVAARAVVSGVPARRDRPGKGALPASAGEEVRSLIARVFALDGLPDLSDGPGQITEWDSLGALRLILALEEDLGVVVPQPEALRLRTVGEVIAMVGGARADADVNPTIEPGRPIAAGAPSSLRELVQRTLDLPAPPALEDGPRQIAQWDSLGALRILLAVEEEFGIRLDEQQMTSVCSLADLASAVEVARTRREIPR